MGFKNSSPGVNSTSSPSLPNKYCSVTWSGMKRADLAPVSAKRLQIENLLLWLIFPTTLSAFFMQIFLSFLKDGWFIDVLGWKVYYFWYFSNKISSEVFYERWGLGLDRQSTLIIRFLWQLFIFLDFGWDFGVQLFYLYDSISWRQIEVIYGLFCLICSYIFFLFVVASSVLFFDNKWYSSSSVTHSTGLESFNLLSLKDP